jgi:predicted CXXCH cytochrome family protein
MKKIVTSVLVLGALVAFSALAVAAPDFKLKPGAKGKLCLNCHVDFAGIMKQPSIHTPVRQGECSGCHNPHTSDHGKLLAAEPGKICAVCHPGMIPEKPASTHQPVAEGKCASCHDPHGAAHKNNLVRGGQDLCFGCHEGIAKAVKGLKFPHAPVAKDCLGCHDPHASKDGKFLLAKNTPGLCKQCHETTGKKFDASHMNYPVADANCSSCHNPHGSNQRAILYDQVHQPVAKRMCNQCHAEAAAADPLQLKRPGYELCRGCHSDMVNAAFGKNRLHWPLASQRGCLECHAPHASKADNLMPGSLLMVCGRCHSDTIQRQEKSETKHEPIQQGECSACHNPHASDNNFLANEASVVDLCATCHDWQKHSTHPIGADYKDMRNPNLSMDCLSCHRSHGTEFKQMIPFATISNLCVQCHEQFKR